MVVDSFITHCFIEFYKFDAKNPNYLMPHIKYEMYDGNVMEMAVNQYVYEDEETAKECLKKLIDNKIGDLEFDLRNTENVYISTKRRN